MAVKTGHDDSVKERGKLADLFASSLILIRGDKRSEAQREALHKALQYFLENRLGVVLPGNVDASPANITELLSLPLTEVFPKRIATWCKNQGVKYLGELFTLPADALWRVSKRREAIAVRLAIGGLGISPTTDVQAIGWHPPYENDPWVLRALETRVHCHANFHASRYFNWPSNEWTCMEHGGCKTVGEYLRDYPTPRYHRLSFVNQVLEKEGLHLRMLVPETWEAPPRDPVGCEAFNKVLWDGVMVEPRLVKRMLEKGYKTHEDLATLTKKQCSDFFYRQEVENVIVSLLAARGLDFAPEPKQGGASDIPTCDLELSLRGTNSLVAEGLVTVGLIMEKTEGQLLRVPNFGRQTLQELRYALLHRGFVLRTS